LLLLVRSSTATFHAVSLDDGAADLGFRAGQVPVYPDGVVTNQ
jgi:hypothetical protein